MRIYLASLIIVLFSCFTASSQVFKTGLVAGICGAQVDGDGYGGYHKLGFIVGGFSGLNLSEQWSTQFEIYFINKGSFKAAHPDRGDYHKFSLNINYIEIPISLRYKYHKFKLEAGVYLAKMLNYQMENEFGPVGITIYPFKSFDFGGFIGLYYDLNDRFSLNLRSKYSIIPIRDFQNKDQNVGLMNKLFNRGWYNSDLNFTLRYQFGE